jgi:cytochrome c biogenesis factor
VTDGRFLGTDPVDAVVPAFRVTTSRVHLTYAETGGAVVSGRAELHSQYPYGVVTNVLIGRGALEDTYVIPLQVTSMEDVPVVVLEVKHIPLMNVVRLGVLLLVLGGVLRLGSGSRTPESEDE